MKLAKPIYARWGENTTSNLGPAQPGVANWVPTLPVMGRDQFQQAGALRTSDAFLKVKADDIIEAVAAASAKARDKRRLEG